MFDRLFDLAKRRHVHHNGLYGIGCDCAYCRSLHRYTVAKVMLRRFRRRFEAVDYIPAHYPSEITLESDIASREFGVICEQTHKNQILSESALP